MKKIGFIGAYDKTDLILNIAKILVTLDKKVLIIDSTVNQKAKYIVPVINPTAKYVTEFEEIDIAVGFSNFEDIKRYLYVDENEELPYEIVLIDVDNINGLENFGLKEAEKNYFVTSFDLYSLKKGLETLATIKEPMNLTKIIFSKEMSKKEDDYLNFLSLEYKINWNEYRIYFPFENGDQSAIIENHLVAKIKFKKLSAQYKDSLVYITEEILKNVSETQIRRAVKTI